MDLLQFYNLFTGVMTDQPVTHSNSMTIGGNQGVTTVPLRIYGAVGQNTNLLDLYADKNQAQPGFGFSALGRFGWGPGGASPQDTFLSRIATQNGHSSDTPGLLITPTLEVTGTISAQGYNFTNGATLTGPAGTPNTLVITQDLTVSRNLIMSGVGARITGDFSNTTPASRPTVQSSTANGPTVFGVIPNGTSTVGSLRIYGNSSPNNAAFGEIYNDNATVNFSSGREGTGTYIPMTLFSGGTEKVRLSAVDSTIYFSGTGTGALLRVRNANSLTLEATIGYFMASGQTGAHIIGNAYWDGTSWLRYATANPATVAIASPTNFQVFTVAAGANPITWATRMVIDAVTGATTFMISAEAPSFYVPNGGAYYGRRASGGAAYLMMACTGDNLTSINNGPNGQTIFVNSANSVRLGYVNDSGNLVMTGTVTGAGLFSSTSAIYLPDGTKYIVADATAMYYRAASHNFQTTGGVPAPVTAQNITCNNTFYIPDGNHYLLGGGGWIYLRQNTAVLVQNAAGGAYVPISASAFNVNSAAKTKTNVRPINDALSFVTDEALHGIRYDYAATGEARVGFVAEPWQTRAPELVSDDDQGDLAFLNYGAIGAIVFEALKQYIDQTDRRLAALEGVAA